MLLTKLKSGKESFAHAEKFFSLTTVQMKLFDNIYLFDGGS
jgi:hypothetical protein